METAIEKKITTITEPSLLQQFTHDTIAESLTHALSIESLILEFGEEPPGLASILFNEWLDRIKPLVYSPEIIEFVYEKTRPYTIDEIIERIGEESLEIMLKTALYNSPKGMTENTLTEMLESRLILLLSSQGENVIRKLIDIIEEHQSKGINRKKVLTTIWAHILNRSINFTGL